MSNGNKHDNGVHEVGKLETLQAYQEDTPGQQVEKYLESINEVIEEKKEKQKKSFMKVFQNPLKGFPYNEELDDNFVKSLEEAKRNAKYLELEFKNKNEAIKAYKHINNKLYPGGTQPFEDFVQEGKWLQFDNVQNVKDVLDVFKKGGLQFKISGGELKLGESLEEGRMKELHGYIEKGMSAKQIAKKMKLDVKTIQQLMDESINEEAPCWKGYKQVGMKKKNGKEVPNCVPMNEAELKEAGIDKSEVDLSHVDEELRNCGCGKTPCETYGEEIEEGKKESVIEKFEALFEAKKLKNLMPEFEKIVKTKGAAKVSGVMVDMFTASVIVKAYAKVNDKNKKRMETSDVYTLIKIAQKMMGLKDEKIVEDYKKVIKMFPRDRDWKKLITKHKRAIDDFRKNNKDLPSKVEDELLGWASQTGEVSGKHDAEDFILSILDEESINESNWGFVFYNKKSLDNFLKDPYIKSVTKNVTIDQEKFRGGKSGFSVGIESDEDLGLNPLAKKVEKIKKKYGKPGVDYAHVEHDGESISEGTWALPKTSKQKKELKDLLKKPVILGKEGDDAADKLYDLIGDDGLFDDLYTAGKKNPKGDARPIIKAKMKELGIKEGKMDGNKLTGQEISVYFRRNKVRDKQTRKAVEIALDHGGAMNYAIKQIEKLKRGLSKSKEVQKALNYANFGEQVRVQEVGFMFKEDSPVAGNIQVEGDPYIPQKKGINKNIANYWKKEIKGVSQKELEKIQSMYMITDHSGVVQMYKAGKRAFIKSLKD